MQRLGVGLGVAVVAFFALPDSFAWHARVVTTWDLGALAYLGLAWTLMAKSDAAMTRDHVLSQDPSGYVIFLLVIVRVLGLVKENERTVRRDWTRARAFLHHALAGSPLPDDRSSR